MDKYITVNEAYNSILCENKYEGWEIQKVEPIVFIDNAEDRKKYRLEYSTLREEEVKEIKQKTAKYLIDEFATILIALKVGKVFNKKLENPISQGGYLFVLENLKRLAKAFCVEIGEAK